MPQCLQMICGFPNIPRRLPGSWKESRARVGGWSCFTSWLGQDWKPGPAWLLLCPVQAPGGFTAARECPAVPSQLHSAFSWRLAPSLPKKLAGSHFGCQYSGCMWAEHCVCPSHGHRTFHLTQLVFLLAVSTRAWLEGRNPPGVLYVVTGTDNRTLLRAWMQVENTLLGFLTLQLQSVGMNQLPDTTH